MWLSSLQIEMGESYFQHILPSLSIMVYYIFKVESTTLQSLNI